MRLFGLTIRTAAHRPASRARCLYRAVIAWSPALLNLLPFLIWGIVRRDDLTWPTNDAARRLLGRSYGTWVSSIPEAAMGVGAMTTVALLVAGWVFAVAHPERGLHDRLAGTRVALR